MLNSTHTFFVANSGGGKTNLVVALLTNPRLFGGNVFDAVYVVSPSVKVDSTWAHLMKYRAKRGQHDDEFFMDTWDGERVQKLIEESFALTTYHKKNNHQHATIVLIVVDDMADASHILHATGNSILNSLFIRGRHAYLSVWICSRRPNLVSSIIRTQMSALFIFKQRNVKDLITFLDEFSAMVDKNTFMDLYKTATENKYNFLYINLLATAVDHMLYWDIDKIFTVSDMDQM
ncbi:hypothetical protein N9L68_06275 [bacterium]|nr:hypothetical protein [bacterium]